MHSTSLARAEAPATPSREQIARSAEEVSRQLAATAAEREADRVLIYEEFDLLRRHGLAATRVAAVYGGAELPYPDLARMFVKLAEGDSNIAQAIIPHYTTVERLRIMGSEAQRRRYYPHILSGAIVGAAVSERGGKLRTDISTRLTQTPKGLRLNGRKWYCTGSLMADYQRVAALDDSGAQVSIMVPKGRAGVTLHDDWNGMGQRLTASGTTDFVDVAVDESEVIPFAEWERERRSFATAAIQMMHASIEVGIALAALADAAHWGRTGARPVKEAGVERASDDPYMQHTIGSIAAHTHAAEAMLYRAAELVDVAATAYYAGRAPRGELDELTIAASIAVSEAKIVSTEAALRAGEMLFEVGGASTTLKSNNFDRHWRNARTHTTHDPVAYKHKVIGNYILNGEPPPVSLYY